MTEEIKDHADDIHPKSEEEPRPEEGMEEEPQVYSVNKELTGWKFGRREFLAATATAAAAVTAAAMVATDKSEAAVPESAIASGEALMLDVALPVMMAVQPAQSFAQTWRFTNKSKTTWCRGVTLHLSDGSQLQAPAPVAVPDIAPGETVNVQVDMKAPADLSTYQSKWHLQTRQDPAPVASGPFVVVAACILESLHNYANNTDETWVLNNPDTSAPNTRVHFSRLETQSNYDFVYLKDGAGQEHQRLTGYYPSDLWSDPVPGSVVQVQLTSNSSVTAWGFCIDLIETIYPLYLALVARAPTMTPTPTATPTPCSCYGVCTCNPHCTCDRIHYWYPN